MKKKIIIISVVLIGVMVVLSSNSWAQRERGGEGRRDRGGRLEEFNPPANRDFDRQRGRESESGRHTRRDFHRPGPRFDHKFHRRHPYGPAYRYGPKWRKGHFYRGPYRPGPKFRPWRHRPFYRHGHPGPLHKRHRHATVNQVNNYYTSGEGYSEPEDEFTASANISDAGFSVSVGVRETN